MPKLVKILIGAFFIYVGYRTLNKVDTTTTFIFFALGLILLLLGLKKEKPERKTIPDSIKKEVLKRQDNHCISCPNKYPLQFHHRIQVSEGGTNEVNNIVAMCANCHDAITRANKK